jgi:hypothetical protein
MPGAGLTCAASGKALLEKPTFQPYWGKLTVRNDRGGGGNVGIIRSPLPRHHLTRPHRNPLARILRHVRCPVCSSVYPVYYLRHQFRFPELVGNSDLRQ